MRLDIERWKSRIPVEPTTLAVLVGLGGLLLLLAMIIEDVVTNETGSFDRSVLMALQVSGDLSKPIGPHWLKPMFIDITALGSPIIITLVTIVSVAYLATVGKRRLATLVAVSIGLGSIVEKLMKVSFDRARPEIVPHFQTLYSLSFPSGHATVSAMTYLTIAALLARTETFWGTRALVMGVGIGLVLLIGISRLYLGVHWPTDVLAGWTTGAAWALGTWFVAEMTR